MGDAPTTAIKWGSALTSSGTWSKTTYFGSTDKAIATKWAASAA